MVVSAGVAALLCDTLQVTHPSGAATLSILSGPASLGNLVGHNEPA